MVITERFINIKDIFLGMGRIIILDDIVESILARPRDVTMFGEEDLVTTKESNYDLYYCSIDGIGHNTNLDKRYKPLPLFLAGNESKLIEKLKAYYETYKNNYGSGFFTELNPKLRIYPLKSLKEGFEEQKKIPYFTLSKDEFKKNITKIEYLKEDFENFMDGIERKTDEIKAQAII